MTYKRLINMDHVNYKARYPIAFRSMMITHVDFSTNDVVMMILDKIIDFPVDRYNKIAFLALKKYSKVFSVSSKALTEGYNFLIKNEISTSWIIKPKQLNKIQKDYNYCYKYKKKFPYLSKHKQKESTK